MAGQALIRLRAIGPPIDGRPCLAVAPYRHFGTSPEEHDRIAREAARAAVLATEAPLEQARLLQRLAEISPGGELLFPFAAKLESFLSATASFDDASSMALPDGDLMALWEDA
jgi:hypothetical protein